MSFVRAANPVWYFVDLVGLGLNDEYYAFFLTNTLPYLPQPVYRDPQGLTAWPDPLEFFPNGTLPDNLYFDPTLVYRIEIRHGDSQTDPLIYEINNFVPGGGTSPDNQLEIFGNENEVSNSQFSEINFVSPLTISVAGTYSIAPGWDLVLTGSGTTTVSQLILTGDALQPTNPPFALRIANSGWSGADLVQRFNGNGALWAGGAVTMSVLARGFGASQNLSLIYAPNAGTGVFQTTIKSGTVTTGNFQVFAGARCLPVSTNPTPSTTAYVDMIIRLPTSGTVDISNVQMIGQSSPLPDCDPLVSDQFIVPYQQETNERMIDHLFHYYRSQLLTKPKDNLLVGWNFPLNPFQFTLTAVTTIVPQTSYIADQTILHQEAASQLQSGKNTVDQRANLVIKAVAAATTTRFALIQYIDPASIKPYWSYVLSAFARARIVTSHSTVVHLKCRLIYRSSLPSAISNTEPISAWAAASDPSFGAGWTAIAPLNDPAYLLPNAYATDEVDGGTAYPSFSFDQFQMPDSNNANMTLGIVIYTMDNLNATAASEDSIEFDRVSLIPSYFGADASPETFDECLSRCQYYYETSFDKSGLTVNYVFAEQFADGSGVTITGYPKGFGFRYNTIKRAAPSTLTFINPDTGNPAAIAFVLTDGATIIIEVEQAIATWALLNSNTKGFSYRAASNAGISPQGNASTHPEGYIKYHFTSDSRLGV